MLATLLMSFALAGQDPCTDFGSAECLAYWEANRDCLDDDGNNRCDVGEQARVRAALGVRSIEEEASSGAEIYRVFYVDGYGNDLPALSFERRPNEAPKAVIYGLTGRQKSVGVPLDVWEAARRRSRFAAVAPPANSAADEEAPGELRICLHSWVVTFEATADHTGEPGVRRRTEDACSRGMTVDYAFELGALAVAAFPDCARLEPEHYRNDITRLSDCLALEGDTLAAADLMNEKQDPPRGRGGNPATAEEWRTWLGLGHAGRIDWAGRTFAEPQGFYETRPDRPDLALFLVERARELGALHVFQERVIGEAANRARIEGEVAYVTEESEDHLAYMSADYTQVWIRSEGEGWRLDSWVVGPFRPLQTSE